MAQFLAADVIVIGAPMYNFAIPSTLKAWIDRVTVAGKTFHYTEAGPEGLAGGKRMIVASGRGGMHAGAPSDFVEPYLSFVLGFMGIKDVEFVRAEGVAYSPQHRIDAIAGALAVDSRTAAFGCLNDQQSETGAPPPAGDVAGLRCRPAFWSPEIRAAQGLQPPRQLQDRSSQLRHALTAPRWIQRLRDDALRADAPTYSSTRRGAVFSSLAARIRRCVRRRPCRAAAPRAR